MNSFTQYVKHDGKKYLTMFVVYDYCFRMTTDNDNILRNWRFKHGISVRDFAKYLDVHPSNYCKYESGERNCNPVLAEKIKRLTCGAILPNDLHGIRISWLMRHKPEIAADLEDLYQCVLVNNK